MFVHVLDILKSSGLSKQFEYTGPIDLAELDTEGDIFISLKLTNAGSRILVSGIIRVNVLLTCGRCLETFAHEMEIPICEEFLPEGSTELDDEALSWDNLSLFSFAGDRIDLYEVVRQNVLAAVPYKSLCREDCKGLIEASTNKESEEGISEEEQNSIDPRLLPLLSIREKAEGSFEDNG